LRKGSLCLVGFQKIQLPDKQHKVLLNLKHLAFSETFPLNKTKKQGRRNTAASLNYKSELPSLLNVLSKKFHSKPWGSNQEIPTNIPEHNTTATTKHIN